jgi:dethiobiotin synthetase
VSPGPRGAVVVTGTDTGVGKTLVTAALAASAGVRGLAVAVVKPAQTGVGTGEESDVEVVVRLAAPATTRELARYPDPLAPWTAARVAGATPLDMTDVKTATSALVAEHDVVLLEGAGGLLVEMGERWDMADLAASVGASVVLVVRPGLGTLNHTALTLEALARRGISPQVVIGAWPASPELVHRTNLADLTDLTGGLAGALPEGAGRLTRPEFTARAASWLGPALYGTFDPTSLPAWRRT